MAPRASEGERGAAQRGGAAVRREEEEERGSGADGRRRRRRGDTHVCLPTYLVAVAVAVETEREEKAHKWAALRCWAAPGRNVALCDCNANSHRIIHDSSASPSSSYKGMHPQVDNAKQLLQQFPHKFYYLMLQLYKERCMYVKLASLNMDHHHALVANVSSHAKKKNTLQLLPKSKYTPTKTHYIYSLLCIPHLATFVFLFQGFQCQSYHNGGAGMVRHSLASTSFGRHIVFSTNSKPSLSWE